MDNLPGIVRFLSTKLIAKTGWSIHSPAQVNEECGQAQFLIPVSARGQNRAQASLERAQALNPMVEVKAVTENVETKPDEFFLQFDAVSELCNEMSWLLTFDILQVLMKKIF